MGKKKKITLKELYLIEKAKPTPAQIFIRKICRATGKRDVSVRSWIYGTSRPYATDRKAIAEALDVDPEGLFEE